METLLKTEPKSHCISVLHGASGQTIPLDLTRLEGYQGTVEGALREAISKNVHPGLFATLDSSQVDIELFCSASGEEQAVEKPLSRHADWDTVLKEAEKCDVELGVSRHGAGAGRLNQFIVQLLVINIDS